MANISVLKVRSTSCGSWTVYRLLQGFVEWSIGFDELPEPTSSTRRCVAYMENTETGSHRRTAASVFPCTREVYAAKWLSTDFITQRNSPCFSDYFRATFSWVWRRLSLAPFFCTFFSLSKDKLKIVKVKVLL